MLPSSDLKASAPRIIVFPVLNSPAHPYRYRRFACPLAGADARLAGKTWFGYSFVPGDLHPLPSASSPGAPDPYVRVNAYGSYLRERPRPTRARPYPFGRLCHGSSARCPTRALASRIPVGHRPWLQQLRSGSLPPCSLPSSLLCRCQTSSRLTSSAYGITPSRCGPTGCPIGRPEDLPGPGAGCTCVHGVSDAAKSGCASP